MVKAVSVSGANAGMKNSGRLVAGLMIGVGLITFIVHWPVLFTQALYLDDSAYLLNNPMIQRPSMQAVGQVFSEVLAPSTVDGYYQPLTMVSLMLDTQMGGGSTNLAPYHRTSLFFHTANAALVVLLFYLLFRQPWVAAIIGLIFGLHPITTETLPWVSDRKTLLATFFILCGLISYVRYTGRKSKFLYAGTLVFYILALLSKPTSTPLPFLFLLLDFWPIRRLSGKAVLEKIPFFVIGLASAIITIISQNSTAGPVMPSEPFGQRVFFMICHNIVFYLQKFFWPADITWYYSFPSPFEISNPAVLWGVIGSAILLSLLFLSLWWTRSLVTGWLFFFVAVFPTLGILQFTPFIAANRYLYFPMLGFLLPVAWGMTWLWNRLNASKRVYLFRAVLGVFVLLIATGETWATRHYLSYWKDNFVLGDYLLKKAVDNPLVYNQIANVWDTRGNIDEAVKVYRLTIEHWPNDAISRYNLASALAKQNHSEEAILQLREAVRLQPGFFDAHFNLCVILAKSGRLDESIAQGQEAVNLKPTHYLAHYTLGRVYLAKRNYDDAISEFKQAIEQYPSYPDAHYYLVTACYLKKDYAQALLVLEDVNRKHFALKFDPKMIQEIMQNGGAGQLFPDNSGGVRN